MREIVPIPALGGKEWCVGKGGGQGVSECGRAFRILSRVKTMAFRGKRKQPPPFSPPFLPVRRTTTTITAREGGEGTVVGGRGRGEKGSGRQLSLGRNNTGAYPGGGRVGLKPSKKIPTSEYNNFLKKVSADHKSRFLQYQALPKVIFWVRPCNRHHFLSRLLSSSISLRREGEEKGFMVRTVL